MNSLIKLNRLDWSIPLPRLRRKRGKHCIIKRLISFYQEVSQRGTKGDLGDGWVELQLRRH